MKYLLFIFCCLTLLNIACSKSRKQDGCKIVTVTSSAPGCGGWGIKVNDTKYPSSGIPDSLKQDGLIVCADYELYEDIRACSCCGGTWANIKSMTRAY